MIDIYSISVSHFTFFDVYLARFQQDGHYIIKDFIPDKNIAQLDEDEILIHLINAKTPNGFELQEVVEMCENLLALKTSELKDYIQNKLNKDPEEYSPKVIDMQSMLKKVKARALWQLGIPQGTDIESNIIRLPLETITPLTELSAKELKQQLFTQKAKAAHSYAELYKLYHTKYSTPPASGLKQLAAYLHQDYALEALQYLRAQPSILDTVEKFWGIAYTKKIPVTDEELMNIRYGKHLIAIQIIHFFSEIRREQVGDFSGAFFTAIANEIETLLNQVNEENLDEELAQRFNYGVIIDLETMIGALLFAQYYAQ